MKDNQDIETIDFAATGCSFTTEALTVAGYYQAVPLNPLFTVSGRRFAGTKTPDAIRDKWMTPRDVVQWMVDNRGGKYDLDAAASADNTVCEKFYDEKTDCLKRWWGKNKHVWLNPPYSHPDPFVLKAIEQMEHGNQIDILLPADNSTAWFADAQKNAAEVLWIIGDVEERDENLYSRTGRLSFIGPKGEPVDGNNKGSVIFIMRNLEEGETQKTSYISISEICPSVSRKRMKKRSV